MNAWFSILSFLILAVAAIGVRYFDFPVAASLTSLCSLLGLLFLGFRSYFQDERQHKEERVPQLATALIVTIIVAAFVFFFDVPRIKAPAMPANFQPEKPNPKATQRRKNQ